MLVPHVAPPSKLYSSVKPVADDAELVTVIAAPQVLADDNIGVCGVDG
ncbi:hypothetical protein FEDK69T_18220 [Flavobacterium enshiense DK69]|nr:hypothetical protein FEDK69T_18220 [Flavobacterium enshiense DK69]